MGEALGGLYDTPHGVAMAILLPYVIRGINYTADYNKFAEIAKAMGRYGTSEQGERGIRSRIGRT